ncbi:MAG: hypothetical protein J5895_00235 [Alphaproteobacteria bacterium]|nr:hypothetical protein [Alphaproteobacteria bacterium]
MSDDKILRKLAISTKTFEQMSEEFIEHLKNEEKIEIIVCEPEDLYHKPMDELGVSGFILTQEEQEKYEAAKAKELEAQKRIAEYHKLPDIDLSALASEFLYDAPKTYKRSKPYVPRTIGRPNSKKKGGR